MSNYSVYRRRSVVLIGALAMWLGTERPPVLGADSTRQAPAASTLPPLVYVCPMAADAGVVEDAPGKCPICRMTLTPTRLDAKWWCPTHQTIIVRNGPGTCPIDRKELVRVTLAEHWSCAEDLDEKLLEPGMCPGGQRRKINYTVRAHGDHNPRHDGQFFMAADRWHHLEGTYPSAGLFRAYFYDNFTRPISANPYSGSVIVLDKNDRELGSFPLVRSSGGHTLEGRIPASLAGLPFRAAARIKFDQKLDEQRFDFTFTSYSKDASSTPSTAEPVPPLSHREPLRHGAHT